MRALHNETGGNVPEYEAVLDSAFAYYHSLGVRSDSTLTIVMNPSGGQAVTFIPLEQRIRVLPNECKTAPCRTK